MSPVTRTNSSKKGKRSSLKWIEVSHLLTKTTNIIQEWTPCSKTQAKLLWEDMRVNKWRMFTPRFKNGRIKSKSEWSIIYL